MSIFILLQFLNVFKF